MTKHAALVVRVSSDHQDTQRQIESVRRLAAEDYPDLLTEEYFEEDGISATKHTIFDRPQGKRLCEAIGAETVAVVIADEQSRLVRGKTSSEWTRFYDLCRASGTRIHTRHEGLVQDDSTGELMAFLRAWTNRGEIDKLNHRTMGGKLAAARAGRWPHGPIPYGYVKDNEGRLQRDPHAAPHVALAFQQVAEGIRKQTAHAAFNKNRGEQMARRTFDKMLRNVTYTGRVTVANEEVQDAHARLVCDDTFDRVQRILDRNAAERRREPRTWPFGGIARCATCGRNLRPHTVKSHGFHYEYVRCDHGEGPDRCPWERIPAEGFEANFVAYLATIGINLAHFLATDPSYATPGEHTTMNEANEALAAARERLQTLGRLVAHDALEGGLASAEYREALSARDAAQDALDRLRGQARSYRDELAEIAARIHALATHAQDEEWMRLRALYDGFGTDPFDSIVVGWERADFEQRRELITATLDRIFVREDGTTEWHFRRGLLEALTLPAAITVKTARTDAVSPLGPTTWTSPW